jgi:acyl-CoA dehydrogenase
VEIQTRARAFVDSVLEPLEVVCDSGDGLPPDVEARARAAARERGLFAPNMPAEWGGAGLDVLLEQVALEEELGRATNCLWAIMCGARRTSWSTARTPSGRATSCPTSAGSSAAATR